MEQEEKKLPDELEEAAKEYATKWHKRPDGSEWKSIFPKAAIRDFIAGAEWRYQKDRGEFAKLKAKEWSDGYNEGIVRGKEKMMEEAVEGYVNYYEDSGGILMAEAQVGCPYHNGDKVKIIVIKEEG